MESAVLDISNQPAAIGYVMLFPLIGALLDRQADKKPRLVQGWVIATIMTYVVGLAFLVSHAMTGWVGAVAARIDPEPFARKHPILVELFDWIDLRRALVARNLNPQHTFVTGIRWEACAKAGYVLDESYKLLCLARNNIHFSYIADPAAFEGQDAIIVDLSASLDKVKAVLGEQFDAIHEDAPVPLTYFGREIMPLKVYRGVGFRARRMGRERKAERCAKRDESFAYLHHHVLPHVSFHAVTSSCPTLLAASCNFCPPGEPKPAPLSVSHCSSP